MARKTTTTSNNNGNNNSNFQQADAWLRLELVDSLGNRHRLPKDVALYLKNHVSANMIRKAEETNEHEFSLVGVVHVVDNAPKEDIAL